MLSTLMKSNNKYLVEGSVSALVRGKAKEMILEKKGYRPWLFDGLDATDQLTSIAAHFDRTLTISYQTAYSIKTIVVDINPVIVNCASGYHTASAKALITGLGMRSRRLEKECHYIHVKTPPPPYLPTHLTRKLPH